jgi:hypothetical protein
VRRERFAVLAVLTNSNLVSGIIGRSDGVAGLENERQTCAVTVPQTGQNKGAGDTQSDVQGSRLVGSASVRPEYLRPA